MKISVYSRSEIEKVKFSQSHIIISITTVKRDVAQIHENELCVGILRLTFPDLERGNYPDLFSHSQARQIWDFVLKHSTVDLIAIHCDAGMSRSPAIAAALAERFLGDSSEFTEPGILLENRKYFPNRLVYRIMVDAIERIKKES